MVGRQSFPFRMPYFQGRPLPYWYRISCHGGSLAHPLPLLRLKCRGCRLWYPEVATGQILFKMSRQKLSPLYSDAMWAVKKHHHFDSDFFVWIYFVWRCKEIERGRQEMRAKIDYFSIGGVFSVVWSTAQWISMEGLWAAQFANAVYLNGALVAYCDSFGDSTFLMFDHFWLKHALQDCAAQKGIVAIAFVHMQF